MAVDQAGHQGAAAEVDDLRAGFIEAAVDGGDEAAVDQHVATGEEAPARGSRRPRLRRRSFGMACGYREKEDAGRRRASLSSLALANALTPAGNFVYYMYGRATGGLGCPPPAARSRRSRDVPIRRLRCRFRSVDFKIVPKKTALMIIDMQYLDAHRDYGMGATARKEGVTARYDYYFKQLDDVVVPNVKRLLEVCRKAGSRSSTRASPRW